MPRASYQNHNGIGFKPRPRPFTQSEREELNKALQSITDAKQSYKAHEYEKHIMEAHRILRNLCRERMTV